MIVAGKFTSTSQKHLSPEILYPAVVHALGVHAGLSVQIVDERGPEPSFARMAEVDIASAIRFLDAKSESDLASVMEEEFMNVIDASKGLPLWRVVVTSDNVVIFAWHHAIGDGQSGLAFLRTLLAGLNKGLQQRTVDSEDAFKIIKTSPDMKMGPPLEKLTDVSVSIRTLVSALAGILLPQAWIRRNKRKIWTGNTVVVSSCDEVKTRVRIISISPSSTSQLLSLSKSHGATLTSTLYVLVVSVLSKLVSESDPKRKFKRISTGVPISLRPLANVPPSVMCECVSSYQKNEPLLLTGFSWEKAAAYNKELHKNIPKTREVIGLIKYLHGKYEAYFKGKLGKKREASFEISNVGVFKPNVEGELSAPDGAEWKIETAYFAQDDGVNGAALKINVAGSPNGGVNVCITWGDGEVDDVLAETFVKELQLSISKLADI